MAIGEERSLSQRPLGEFCSGQGPMGRCPHGLVTMWGLVSQGQETTV